MFYKIGYLANGDNKVDISSCLLTGATRDNLKKQIEELMETELDLIHDYLYIKPSKWRQRGSWGWVAFKEYIIEAGYEIGMFWENVGLSNTQSVLENEIVK